MTEEKLSERQKDIIALYDENYTQKDIAERLSLSLGQVAGVLRKLKERGIVNPKKAPNRKSPKKVEAKKSQAPKVVPISKILLRDAGEDHCRWPIGHPREGGKMQICGNLVNSGDSYCPEHRARSFHPTFT